ncbi:MAG TPA: hypothetical protein DCG58_15920, partial [Hyphomonas adhaerens]|nr:hypothetical protein [Hyphomonas adhaerens]
MACGSAERKAKAGLLRKPPARSQITISTGASKLHRRSDKIMGRAETKLTRKRDLIQATVTCVNRYGYAESTIQKIAAEAGFTGGTIY